MRSPGAEPLRIIFTISAENHIPDATRLSELLSYAASLESISGELGVWLCTDEEIADLHLRFMDIPGATDVITFAGDGPGGGYLGDIAVSVETAAAQASDVGHAPEREVAYLCLHGLLHIAGFDDRDDIERATMIQRQDELLDGFERESPGDW